MNSPVQRRFLDARVQPFADLLFLVYRSGTLLPERFAYPLFTKTRYGYNLQPEPLGAAPGRLSARRFS